MFSDDMIEFVFSHVKDIETAIMEKRLDSGGGKTGGNGTGHSQISDTTAIKAIRNAMELNTVCVEFGGAINGKRDMKVIRRPETWLQVVKDTYEYYGDHDAFIHDYLIRRYQNGETWQETCKNLHMGKGKYYACMADVIHTAELYAVGYELILPWHKVTCGANMEK